MSRGLGPHNQPVRLTGATTLLHRLLHRSNILPGLQPHILDVRRTGQAQTDEDDGSHHIGRHSIEMPWPAA